jgi:hypothetical protein
VYPRAAWKSAKGVCLGECEKGGFGGLESHGAFGPLRPTGLHRVALGGGETALEKNHLKASTSKTLPVTAQ